MFCHDSQVRALNPGWVELEGHCLSDVNLKFITIIYYRHSTVELRSDILLQL